MMRERAGKPEWSEVLGRWLVTVQMLPKRAKYYIMDFLTEEEAKDYSEEINGKEIKEEIV